MGDRARDKVSWDDFSVWLSALKPCGIGLSEHFSAKYQDEAHYRWVSLLTRHTTQLDVRTKSRAHHLKYSEKRSLSYLHITLVGLASTNGCINPFQSWFGSIGFAAQSCAAEWFKRWEVFIQIIFSFWIFERAVCRWLWLSIRLIWLYGIWFDSEESTSQNPKSSKSSSGIPRMYEVTFDGVGCFMITNSTSFDIIRALNVPTTSFQRS